MWVMIVSIATLANAAICIVTYHSASSLQTSFGKREGPGRTWFLGLPCLTRDWYILLSVSHVS
jgi:hypothetical protein